ncbi:complement component receptor 1-like protein [Bombina bombina]|uniref:complement component receptor 1-like protein n=1 Tax=Bombina bombina TaxID=8345 RepID=UPI00235B0C58|nr:complement component receptor 1-like protein [Bombina bombina]
MICRMMKIPKSNAWNFYITAIFYLTLFHIFITSVHGVICPEPKVFNGEIKEGTPSSFHEGLERGYKVMDLVKVECNTFYSLKGADTIVCGYDLKWHPSIPICQSWFDCPYPAIENGYIVLKNDEEYIPERVGHGFGWRHTVHLQCESDFVMQGKNSSVCSFYRKWKPDLPKCISAAGE